MLKRQREIVSVAVALSLVVVMGVGLTGKPAETATDYGITGPVTDSSGVTTWDKVKFGSYYQTAEFEPEPIKWRVLSVDGDDAFLVADESLDCKPYNIEDKDVTWETCSLRRWLNEDFYNEAFNRSEQEAIRETAVVNEDNPRRGTAGGNDTTDHIYLLSMDEIRNVEYGFVPEFHEYTKTRELKNTDYAKCNNAYNTDEGKDIWWLRSPGYYNTYASSVNGDGVVAWEGDLVDDDDYGVRPALHLNLSSSVHADAGEVDSEGNVTNKDDGISAPTTDFKGVTTWDCVYLGNYRQKATWKKEPIEWRVLSVDGDDAFLVADESLDCKPYNVEDKDVTWETCSLRRWLNEDFYNEAFNRSEQEAIRETAVVNKDNQEMRTAGGNDTMDYIYLLSLDEAGNTDYGFIVDVDGISEARQAKNTDFVKCKNINSSWNNGFWWLRSSGEVGNKASFVTSTGEISCYGGCVDYLNNAVRPVLHLNLSSSSWSKSGQVRSGEIEVPIPGNSPSASERSKPGSTPNKTETAPQQETNLPQMINALAVAAFPIPLGPSESPTASGSPKSGCTPDQTAALPQTTTAPEVTVTPVETSPGEFPSVSES